MFTDEENATMPPMPMPGPTMTGHMNSMTHMAFLPGWARIAWALALAIVAALHIWHAREVAGLPRWWHFGHTVMALGMLAMYAANPISQRGLDRTLIVLFAVATLAGVVTVAVLHRRHQTTELLWVGSTLDMAAMAFMAAVMNAPHSFPAVLSWLVVAYLACQSAAWSLGLWNRAPGTTITHHTRVDVRVGLAVMAASMAYMLAAMAAS